MTTPAPNYYANNPLNRLSYLRTSPAFLASALSSDKARFVLYSGLNPLCAPPSPTDGAINLHTVSWADVQAIVGAASVVFTNVDGKNEQQLGQVSAFFTADERTRDALTTEQKAHHFINQPPLVFLGVDERSAPEEAKSLPLTKPDENSTLASHSPYGVPYWALDVTTLKDLRDKFEKTEDKYEFVDMRAGMASIPGEEASIAAEGRALVDWNKRNVFCPACSRPMRSVWAGWKKVCVPGVAAAPDLEAPPPCISKKGVHNFSYPRTDPVCIMAVLSPDRERILLGRQRAWPKKFYSCLAGFVETGETLEEAARREVYEEAGIEIGDVYYHSSQPWPYPSSLMIGSICVAKDNQAIRLDLDNELEDARWFTRADVLAVLNGDGRTHLSRDEVSAIDGKENAAALKEDFEKTNAAAGTDWFRMPPVTAIANVLIESWARNTYINGGKL